MATVGLCGKRRRFAFEQLERRNLLAANLLISDEVVGEVAEFDEVFVSAPQHEAVIVNVLETIEFDRDNQPALTQGDAQPNLILQIVIERVDLDDRVDFDQADGNDDVTANRQTPAAVAVVDNTSEVESDLTPDNDAVNPSVLIASPSPVSSMAQTGIPVAITSADLAPPTTSVTPTDDAELEDSAAIEFPLAESAIESAPDQDLPQPDAVMVEPAALDKQTTESVESESPVQQLVTNLAERLLPSEGRLSIASLSADFAEIDSAMTQLFDELDSLGDEVAMPFTTLTWADVTYTAAVGLIALEVIRRRKRRGYHVFHDGFTDDDAVVWMFPEFSGVSVKGV